jgi:hypothetical protein
MLVEFNSSWFNVDCGFKIKSQSLEYMNVICCNCMDIKLIEHLCL